MSQESNFVNLDIKETNLLNTNKKLLDLVLLDRTTGKNIRWGTDSYSGSGERFQAEKEIKASLITGWYDGFIRPRADKDSDTQLERTRNKAEVFTPSWIIKKQVDAVLSEMKDLSFEDFINTRWLEITCGEAPYMTNRYDMVTGESIGLEKRAGFIDEKFRRLNKKISKRKEWIDFAVMIFKSSYGYEYQGDSLILARENLLLTFVDNYFYMFGEFPDNKLLIELADIISKNVFQMDGLTYHVPFSEVETVAKQLSMFENESVKEIVPVLAKIDLWDKNTVVSFKDIAEESDSEMKFDVVIGNPPFQEDNKGRNRNDAVYPFFLDAAYECGDVVCMITPARFLFNVGSTNENWNKRMLSDPNVKVLFYESNSNNVFSNTSIEGGIVVTYRDVNKVFGPIDVFSPFVELRTIVGKIRPYTDNGENSINKLMFIQNKFDLDNLYKDYPELKEVLGGKGKEKRLTSSIFKKAAMVFSKTKAEVDNIAIYGRENNVRVYKYISEKYLEEHEHIDYFKVFVPAANGSPTIGEADKTVVIGKPVLGKPLEGHTQTFISIGKFRTKFEGEACLKYLKTKFARALLAVKKVTQNNKTKDTWSYVPLQDFTLNSDIDWSKSIPEIDQQLYKKYGLSQEEIDFIEKNVQEMK